jgi:hypothetical protein
MSKHHFFTALLKGGYPTGKEPHASAKLTGSHTGLTADEREQIAAQVRAIASRAAEEYRQRNEPIPPYVLSAMNCDTETAEPAQPAPESRGLFGSHLGAAVTRSLVHICVIALLPMILLGLHRQGKEQDNHIQKEQDNHIQIEQQMQTLQQQNGALMQELQEIKSRKSDPVPTEELNSSLQNLNQEVARVRSVVSNLHAVQINCTPQSLMVKNARTPGELSTNLRRSGTCSSPPDVRHDSGRPNSQNAIEEPPRASGQRADPSIAAVIYEEPLIPTTFNPSGSTQLEVSNNRGGSRIGGVFSGMVGFVKGLPGHVTGRHSQK